MTDDTTSPDRHPTSQPRPQKSSTSDPPTILRLDPGAFRRHLISIGADPARAETLAREAAELLEKLASIPGIETNDTIHLPLTRNELFALHTLLAAAYHDPGTGSFVGPCLRDWRDHLDTLHRKTIALFERTEAPNPNPGDRP